MKNINEILAGLDIQIPEDKQAEFDKTFAENYKTIADYDRQKDKLVHAEGDLKTARESLEAFKNVDVKDLQNQISKLTQDLQDKDAAHAAELADRDFTALLDTAISAKHGRSTKAVKALLDMDSLKASKNQQADIDAALDQLAKDSSYLFDDGSTPPPYAGVYRYCAGYACSGLCGVQQSDVQANATSKYLWIQTALNHNGWGLFVV